MSERQCPLLSIVIPTRNRVPYALAAIRAILARPDRDLELVIQDSSDTPTLKGAIGLIADTRLRYAYTPPPCSAMDNFNRAIALATGEYVCLIGDDDGISYELMAATRWAAAQGLDALRPDNRLNYLWPDTSLHKRLRHAAGTLTIEPYSGKISYPDLPSDLSDCLRSGAQNYLSLGLPKLYHGVVKRSLLLELKARCGAFFIGLSPDIFAAVALGTLAHKVVRIDYPLTIPGACGVSASAEYSAGIVKGPLATAPHFRDIPHYQWSELVPRFYCSETIWADTALAALSAVGRDDLRAEFSVPALFARCLTSYPEFSRLLLSEIPSRMRSAGLGWEEGCILVAREVVRGPARRLVERATSKLRRTLNHNGATVISELDEIGAAMRALDEHRIAQSNSFSQCIARAPVGGAALG